MNKELESKLPEWFLLLRKEYLEGVHSNKYKDKPYLL